ncbi:RHS repeat-associated core domain-containing protein [Vibrio aquimaris]|nr:RHS repeat-associated core domain-containing protein [Vibrio aquimaris]
MKIHKFIFFLLMFVVSSAHATRVDVYMKDVSRDTYQFYAKLVEPRPMVLIHGDVVTPIPLGPETPEIERTSYLRVWKQGSQWKAERFTPKQTTQYNEFVRTSQKNKLARAAHNSYSSSSSVYVRMGSYKFSINNYKSSPSVVQSGIVSGLIKSQFAYPYASFAQTENSISVDSYVTDGGQAALSLSIPFAQTQARLSFVENSYRIEGLESLKADPSVTVNTAGNLTTIDVEHEDKVVSYFFKTQTWVDDASGIKNANGSGWAKAPYQANYLSAIGQCERLKSQSEPSCYLPIQLDYGRSANLNKFPYLAGWKDDKQVVTNNYKYMGGVMAIVSRDTKQTSGSSRAKSTYSYTVNASGQPQFLSQESVPNPSSNTRNLTTYITHGDYAGLANKIERFGHIDNTEYRLSETDIEWRLTSNGQAQKARVVESVYDIDGNISQTKTIENSYDDQNRLEKRITITDNNNGEQVEDQVEYRFENDYAVGKIERRSVISPAYENGVSDQLVKEFEYVYRDDKLVEQITRQGGYTTSDAVTQDAKGRVTARVRKVNGQVVLRETSQYTGDNLTQRCENGQCIDYQYRTTATGRVETSSINGTPYEETHYDDKNRVVAKTARGITKKTEFYAIDDVPARLNEWVAVCPSDTVSVVYNATPSAMTCVTSRGQYQILKGMDDRFIISAELKQDKYSKQLLLPHFEGDEAVTYAVKGDAETREIEYEVNGQSESRSELLDNVTESYDKWGNVVRRYHDITGLLYQVDDHLGNTIRFTYNALGKLTSSELNSNPETKIVYVYDARGQRTQTIDPSRGDWKYHYNLKGQLAWQQDANGDRTEFSYDNFNRVIRMSTPESTVCYEFPTKLPLAEPKRVVKVAGRQQTCANQETIYEEVNTYEWPNGWLKKREITLEDGYTQTTSYEYNSNGQVKKETTPSRLGNEFALEIGYSNGSPYKWTNAQTGELYKEILAKDAQQRVTNVRFGNGLEEFYRYDRVSGQLLEQSATRSGSLVYRYEYRYNSDDLLSSRKRHFYYRNRSETSFEDEYRYDEQDRLKAHTIKQFCANGICQEINANGFISATSEFEYDKYGNITYKTGVGDYYYESADPFKLTRLEEENGETRHFTYDKNGNMLSDGLRQFRYESNRLVYVGRVSDNQDNTVVDRDETRFTYGPDGQQIVRTDKRFDVSSLEWVTEKSFSSGAYTYNQTSGNKQYETYGGNGFALTCSESSCSVAYSHTDRLGQQIMVTNAEGTITSQTFTDPFGSTHNVLMPEMDDAFAVSPTYSSMFGHVGVAGFDLIHMKGRVYDPYLARFIQADAFIKGKESVANYNRYTFNLNNPVNNIDPSGYFSFGGAFKSIGRGFKSLGKEIGRGFKKLAREASRVANQIRAEAKRAESRVRNEVKRAESRVRNEVQRVERQIRHEAKRFERRARHEVGRWESDVRHGVKIVGQMIKENPEMVLAMAVAAWVSPYAMTYFSEVMVAQFGAGMVATSLAGAATGATVAATSHVISSKGDLKGIEKSILHGALTGGIAAGVAHGLMETQYMIDLVGEGTTLANTVSNVIKSVGMAGADSLIYDRDFSDTFLASFLQTTANGYIHQYTQNLTTLVQSFVSGVVGGMITSEIYGGDFATNFAHGFIGSYIDYTQNELGGMFDFDFSLVEAVELTMDFIPVVSNLKAAYEFSTGETIFGGVELGDLDRNLAGATILLGPVGKAAVKTGKVAYTVAKHSDEAVDMLTASSKVHDATNVASFEKLRSSLAAEEIIKADRVGTALTKQDKNHLAASFLTKDQLAAGKVFIIRGGDGVQRTLLQTKGTLDGKSGVFEYLLESDGTVSHQLFKKGRINGVPTKITQ